MSLMTHTPNRRARLAREIRTAMLAQGKTPQQLAAATGFSPDQLDVKLAGEEPLLLEELEATARFLGFRTSELSSRTDVAA